MARAKTAEPQELAVHPVADLFPMLADDELAELAEDIKQRGLLQPIVLDAEGRVLDGRNRLAACRLAGVEPAFTTYDGGDPDGYAVAVNIARRHLSKGQRAMLMALSGYKNYTEAEISKQYVSWARTVTGYQDLTEAVVKGITPLAQAYETARERNEATAEREAKLFRLRTGAPDLADHVDGVRLDLDEALAAMEAREAKAREEEERQRREEEERRTEEERARLEAERKRLDEQRDARALLQRVVDLLAPQGMSDGFAVTWTEQLGDLDAELGALLKRAETAANVLLDVVEGATK